jgi:hypothetical protein
MLVFFTYYSKQILIAALVLCLGLWIFLSADFIWFIILLTSFLAAWLFVYELAQSVNDKSKLAYWDIREYGEHQEMSIDSLLDFFKDDQLGRGFSLKTKMEGIFQGKNELISPYSEARCLAYRITIGLIRPMDIRQHTLTKVIWVEEKSLPMRMQQGPDQIQLATGGILNFNVSVRKTLSWDALQKEEPHIINKVNEVVQLQNIPKTNFTGIQIIEETLCSGEKGTVFGTCCMKDGEGLILRGNNRLNDQNSLYITTIIEEERKRKLIEIKKNRHKRRLLTLPLIMMLCGLVGFWAAKDLIYQIGFLYYRSASEAREIELSGTIEYGEENLSWTLAGSSTGDQSFIKLLDDKNEPFRGHKDSYLKMTNLLNREKTYIIGKDDSIAWKGTFWLLELRDQMLEPQSDKETTRQGRLYIKNSTEKKIIIKLNQNKTSATHTFSWTYNAWMGTEYTFGNYTIFYTSDNDGNKVENEVRFATGDEVKLLLDDEPIATLVAGYSPYLQFEEEEFWFLDLNPELLMYPKQKLFLKNTSSADFRIDVLTRDGKRAFDDFWTMQEGEGADSADGNYLTYGDETIMVEAGMQIRLTKIEPVLLWEGKLSDCPYADYDFLGRRWQLAKE